MKKCSFALQAAGAGCDLCLCSACHSPPALWAHMDGAGHVESQLRPNPRGIHEASVRNSPWLLLRHPPFWFLPRRHPALINRAADARRVELCPLNFRPYYGASWSFCVHFWIFAQDCFGQRSAEVLLCAKSTSTSLLIFPECGLFPLQPCVGKYS